MKVPSKRFVHDQTSAKEEKITTQRSSVKRFLPNEISSEQLSLTMSNPPPAKKTKPVSCTMCMTYKLQLVALENRLQEKDKEIARLETIVENGEYEGII